VVILVSAVVTLWVLYCTIIGLVFGFKDDRGHLVLTFTLCMTYATMVVLFRWFRNGELDPKVKYVIWMMVAVLLMMGISLNIYVWSPPPYCDPQPSCAGLYRTSDDMCFPNANDCFTPYTCLIISGDIATCGTLANSSTTTGGPPYFM